VPTLPYPKLWEMMDARPPAAAVFLYGDESYALGEAVDRLVDHFVEPATRDFNFDQLRGSEVSPEDLASLLATPPMMASWRVVVLRDAQGLSAKGREVVEAVAANPPPGLVLLVTAQIPSGSRAKFYSNLQRVAASVEFAAVDPLDLPGWLIQRAHDAHGLEMELDAARALGSAIGSQLGILASELEKLASYVQGRTTVTLDDVRAVGGYVPRADRWSWFDLVAEKRFAEALRLLPELLTSGENGVGLVIGIAAQLVRVGLVVAGGREALEKELKPHQRWLAGRVAPAARAWSAEEIDAAMAELLRTDRLLKSAPVTDRHAMEELLLRIADRVAPRRSAA
jgi:DNA polymerase-3 subunit delta